MKWSEYTQQMDRIQAPDSLKEKLYAMAADADPLDAPHLAAKKPALRLTFGKGHGLQIAAALVCCVGLAGLMAPGLMGRSTSADNGAMEFAVQDTDFVPMEPDANGTDSLGSEILRDTPTNDAASVVSMTRSAETRKIIYTADLRLEATDYDKTLTQLEAAVAETGGYVQRCDSYTRAGALRNVSATYRIPAARYADFLDKAAACGNLIRTSEQTDDVTTQFIDTQARVSSLQAQRDHLLALQEKTESLPDLLTIAEQLTQVQYELESWQQQLNFFADQVDYCTVNVTLEEVETFTPTETTLWARITQAVGGALADFGAGLADGLVWLLARWPWLLALSGGGAWLYHLRKKKKQAR